MLNGDLSSTQTHYWDGEDWGWQPLWLKPNNVIDAVSMAFGREATDARYLASGLLNQSWQIDDNYVLRVSRPNAARLRFGTSTTSSAPYISVSTSSYRPSPTRTATRSSATADTCSRSSPSYAEFPVLRSTRRRVPVNRPGFWPQSTGTRSNSTTSANAPDPT